MSEEYSDYSKLCPEGGDPEEFNRVAIALVEEIKEMPAPTDREQGVATAINLELDAVRKALRGLSHEVRDLVTNRELNLIAERRRNAGEGLFEAHNNVEMASIVFGNTGILEQFEGLVEEDFAGKKEDRRKIGITKFAAFLWENHGGKITQTENNTGFLAFLESLLGDAELKAGARTLTVNHLKQ